MQLSLARTRLVALSLALIALAGCDYFVSPAERVERARGHIEAGDQRAALVELKNALQKRPDLHEGRLMLAEVALWVGDAKSAEDELRNVPATVEPARAADLRARIDLALGRSAELLERLEQDTALPQPRRDMYRGLALLAQRQDAVEAEAALSNAVKADAALVPAHIGLIESLTARGEDVRALELSERLVKEHADSAEIWLARGVLLARRGADGAVEALERARTLAPKQLDVPKQSLLLSALVDLHLANGQVDAARASSEQLQRLNPRSPLAMLVSSRISMASNDYVAATTELRRVVNGSPQFTQARFMLGVALAAQGNLEQSSQELAQVVEQAPQFLEARQLLAQVRMRLNDPDGALQVLVPGLQSDSTNLQLSSMIDALRVQTGDAASGIAMLERELAKNPQNASIETELAAAYLQSGAAAKALTLLRASKMSAADPRREALWLQALLEAEGQAAVRQRIDALLESHPANPRIAALSAGFLARLGQIDAGRQLLKAKLQSMRDAPELYFARAQLEWAARQPLAAREALQELLRLHPEHTQARIALSEIELATGNREQAKAHLEEVRKRDPRAGQVRLMLANLALADKDPTQVESLVGEALKSGMNEAEVRGNAGLMYLNAGRYDQAIQHLREGIRVDSESAPLWLQLGRAQLALNQHEAARESFERALRIRPQWLAAEGALAFLDLQVNAGDAALARVTELRRARPNHGAVAALEGNVLFALRRYAESSEAYDRAGQLEPNSAHAMSSYQARLSGKLPNATAPLEGWIERHPDDVAARLVLGDAYTQAGERRKAIQQYEQVLSRQPQNVRALNNVAWLYHESRDARAVEFARKALAAAPDAPPVMDTLGWILVETGAVEQALPLLERAAAHAAAEPEIGYHYAVALIRAGQVDKGTAQLRRLLQEHAAFPSRTEAERLARARQGV